MRKFRVLGIKIIVICHAKINSNCIHKGKEKFVWGGEKTIISAITTTSQITGVAAAAPAALLSTPMHQYQ